MAKKKSDCIRCGNPTTNGAICKKCQDQEDKFVDHPDARIWTSRSDEGGEEEERSSSDNYHGIGSDDL